MLVAGAARQLPADRHSGALNGLHLSKGFIASAEMEADERYRSYLQVLSRAGVAELMMTPMLMDATHWPKRSRRRAAATSTTACPASIARPSFPTTCCC